MNTNDGKNKQQTTAKMNTDNGKNKYKRRQLLHEPSLYRAFLFFASSLSAAVPWACVVCVCVCVCVCVLLYVCINIYIYIYIYKWHRSSWFGVHRQGNNNVNHNRYWPKPDHVLAASSSTIVTTSSLSTTERHPFWLPNAIPFDYRTPSLSTA